MKDLMDLQSLLDRSIEWLKYAEAKNGILVGATVALILGTIEKVGIPESGGLYAKLYAANYYAFLVLSVLLSFISFIPRLRMPVWRVSEGAQNKNPLYFAVAAKLTKREFLNYINSRYGRVSESESLDEDICEQIVNVSFIALRKLEIFNCAIWLIITAIVTPLGAILLLALRE